MKIMGLTGGIACGKSTVAGMLASLGAAIVDADAISHALAAKDGKALPLLREAFGESVFTPDDTLDRKALASLVFGSPKEKQTLDALMHPLIEKEMQAQIETCRKKGEKIVVLDVPLLFEANLSHLCDCVLCVSASQETQIKRMQARDGLTREQALLRIQNQWDTKRKEALSDFVLSTEESLETIQKTVATLVGKE